MSGINKVILIGRLGKDPEVKNFDNGGTISSFTLATSETYKDKKTGEVKEITDWHNIAIKNIERIIKYVQAYVKKGHRVYVEGKLKTRSWEKDGITRYLTEVVVDTFQHLETKKSNEAPKEEPKPGSNDYESYGTYTSPQASTDITDDLPF